MFKELDIRGKYPGEVNEENFRKLGGAISRSYNRITLGMDYRINNKALFKAFAEGYSGEIELIGIVPTPVVAFSADEFGAMMTASHNPAPYAGIKFFRNHTYITREELKKIRESYEGIGVTGRKNELKLIQSSELVGKYLDAIPEISEGIFDLAGGAVCALKDLFPRSIFSKPDPEFKLHSPEPKEDTLVELKKETLKEGKVGFAFDGDGDRLQVCDSGKLIEGDVTAAFVSEAYLKRGDRVILSIDCREEVFQFLNDAGMKPITSKVGDAYVVAKALQEGAIFSAERSGHFAFYHHAPNSDGVYAAAVLSKAKYGEVLEFAKQFKNITLKEEVWFQVDFDKLKVELEQEAENLETIDGIKAKFEEFTLLIRASTTEPKIRINSEAENKEKAKKGIELANAALKKCKK